MAEHGAQLEPQYYRLDSKVEVDEDGYKQNVTIEGIPDSAPDFGACMRIALQDMPIADEPFREGVKLLKYRRQETNATQRALVGHPVVIVVAGVTIVVSEVMLEAGAVTILTAVTVKVVEKAVEDVAELAKKSRWLNKCVAHYTACITTALGGPNGGNHYKSSLCDTCFRRCDFDKAWPGAVGAGSCEYWTPGW